MNKYLIIVGFLACANANANLLVNGSFENGVTGNYQNVTTSSPITGWTLAGGTSVATGNNYAEIFANNNPYNAGAASAGNYFIELDVPVGAGVDAKSYVNSGITQSISSITGATYTLSFDYSARPNTSTLGTNNFEVFWNSVSLGSFNPGVNAGSTRSWLTYTNASLTNAVSGNNILSFFSSGATDDRGVGLDNIVLTRNVAAVPEPETYGMMLAGLAMLGFSVRRRKS